MQANIDFYKTNFIFYRLQANKLWLFLNKLSEKLFFFFRKIVQSNILLAQAHFLTNHHNLE